MHHFMRKRTVDFDQALDSSLPLLRSASCEEHAHSTYTTTRKRVTHDSFAPLSHFLLSGKRSFTPRVFHGPRLDLLRRTGNVLLQFEHISLDADR